MTMEFAESAERITPRIDNQRLLDMIPHRYPFLLVDRVLDVVADVSAVGIKCVSSNDPWFQGHFPGRPIMPGVLIIETMAQTAAVLVVETLGPRSAGKLVYFMSVDGARFRKPVYPGDVLQVHIRKLRSRANVWKFSGEALVDGALVAEATSFSAMIMDR